MRPAIVSGGFSSPQRLILGFGGGVTVIRGDSVIRGDTAISGSGEYCTGGRDRACDDESGNFSGSDGCEDKAFSC